MGDVVWMTVILIAHAAIASIVCGILASKCETVVGEKRKTKEEV